MFLELLCVPFPLYMYILSIELAASRRWNEQVNQLQGIAYLRPFDWPRPVQILLIWSRHQPILFWRDYNYQQQKDRCILRHDGRCIFLPVAVVQSWLSPAVSNKFFGIVLSGYMDSLRAYITKSKDRATPNNVSPPAVYRVRTYWHMSFSLVGSSLG